MIALTEHPRAFKWPIINPIEAIQALGCWGALTLPGLATLTGFTGQSLSHKRKFLVFGMQ